MDGQGRDAEGGLASRPWRGLRKISSCGEKRRQIWDVWRQESRLWEGEERSGIPAESGEQQPQRGAAAGSESESTAGALPSSILPLLPQTRQLTDLRTQDTAGATAGLTPVAQRLRRDTHFPICIFCCGCCRKAICGMCCKT
uniref:Hepcidin antimicrobial peptide n=1 Tax=Sus scrofa TaxID=9823 RepID=A0A8D1FKC7_PIG